MKRFLLIVFMSLNVMGCDGVPGWSKPSPDDVPDNPPNVPVVDVTISVADIVKPTDDLGMEATLVPLFAAYKDVTTVKRDAGILAAMYNELADLIERDGSAKSPQIDTTQNVLDLQDSQINFMIAGTDFGSITRRYPTVVGALKAAEQRVMGKEVGPLDNGSPTMRSKVVNMFRAMAWGCYCVSK